MPLRPGHLLGGRYALQELLATGGSAEVWRGTDRLLDRAVAVKVPRAHAADRLLDEARHAAAVNHPGIAAVFDVRRDELPYLVLEFVDGQPLSQLLAEAGPLPPERVRDLVAQVAQALEAAHATGLLHRDIKPANLLVTADGTVKVTDFGISLQTSEGTGARDGFVVGTAQYLSPEQVRGEAATPASDLYALGVVAYECLAGARPFDGAPREVLRAHCTQHPPPLPRHVPPDLRELVGALLDKNPALRPSAAEVAGTAPRTQPLPLPTQLATPLPVPPSSRPRWAVTGPATAPHHRPLPPLRWRRILAAAAAVAVALVLTPVLFTGDTSNPPAEAETAPAPVDVRTVSLFHPEGSDDDHPEELPFAVDGDVHTAWTTQRYATPEFGNLRPGVGVLFDLGEPVDVAELRLNLAFPDVHVRVHAGDVADASLLDSPPLGAFSPAPAAVTVTPRTPARYWVVWFDRLPPQPPHHAGISEATFLAVS